MTGATAGGRFAYAAQGEFSAEKLREAFAYVCRIRNKNKARYAMAYLNHLQGAAFVQSDYEVPSYMARQAVEMELVHILRST